MDDTTVSPWECLENGGSLARVSCVWRRELGSFFPAFQAAFLQRKAEAARVYPCPRGCGCAHEVIYHGASDIVAVCRCERWNCDDIPLQPGDIALWELSWARIGRALC